MNKSKKNKNTAEHDENFNSVWWGPEDGVVPNLHRLDKEIARRTCALFKAQILELKLKDDDKIMASIKELKETISFLQSEAKKAYGIIEQLLVCTVLEMATFPASNSLSRIKRLTETISAIEKYARKILRERLNLPDHEINLYMNIVNKINDPSIEECQMSEDIDSFLGENIQRHFPSPREIFKKYKLIFAS